jgi:glycosyltransferase involved in cell wall biosynthesis
VISTPPEISIIIPTYNRCWILRDAIDSALSQTFSSREVIVVDDGSTDATATLLSEYSDNITVLHQENRGVSAARNAGIAAARGKYVAFLDSDDMWMPEKLLRQQAFFLSQPEAVICQTDEIWIRNGVRVNPGRRHRKPSGMIFEPSLHLCLVSPSAVMIRKDILNDTGGFNETYPACEDYDLWLRIGLYHPVYLIDRPLVIKRGGHDDQLSRNPGLDRYRILSIANMLENHVLNSQQRQAAVNVLTAKCRIYVQGCVRRGKSDEAAAFQAIYDHYAEADV